MTLASVRTDGIKLASRTPEILRYPIAFNPETQQFEPPSEEWDDWTFVSGSLFITAIDGSSVLLEAENDDDASARLTLNDSAGTSTSFDEAWNSWRETLRFDDVREYRFDR